MHYNTSVFLLNLLLLISKTKTPRKGVAKASAITVCLRDTMD